MKFLLSLLMAVLLSTTLSTELQAQTSAADTTITVKVKGITCGVDLKMIQSKVEELEGVSTFEVAKEGATTSLAITYDPQAILLEDLYAAIEGTGGCKNPEERPYTVKRNKQ